MPIAAPNNPPTAIPTIAPVLKPEGETAGVDVGLTALSVDSELATVEEAPAVVDPTVRHEWFKGMRYSYCRNLDFSRGQRSAWR
jgi:hypothetical protein